MTPSKLQATRNKHLVQLRTRDIVSETQTNLIQAEGDLVLRHNWQLATMFLSSKHPSSKLAKVVWLLHENNVSDKHIGKEN